MGDEETDHHRSGKTVDVPGSFKPAEQVRENAGPSGVGELERHPGQRKTEKAHNHRGVQNPVQPREPEEFLLRVRLFLCLSHWRLVLANVIYPLFSLSTVRESSAFVRSRRICSARGSQSKV